tara:strand:+ start:5189 stop:6091 length:903 start_codon:yes stop_codon:yes gene_type:complete
MNFYDKFPDFDWRFYLDVYPDLRNNGIKTEHQCKYHYVVHGYKEKRRTHDIIKKKEELYSIPFTNFTNLYNQSVFSSGVSMFKKRTFKKYNLKEYFNDKEPCLFFGMYNDDDLKKIKTHKGLRIVIWCGDDANSKNVHSYQTITEIKKLNNIIHISKSKSTFNSLKKINIESILVNYNVVDNNLFFPIPKEYLGKKIFIFNGQHKGREHKYGDKYYDEVVKRLPQYKFIFSNKLNARWEDMPNIYKQCFIMLRLTSNDGNANSVQECQAMKIPVIHNQSDYGLKWKTVDDIIQHIYKKSI